MQRLEGLMRKAMQEYEMIEPGDHVCIGVSGGKDSVALTIGLARLRAYYEKPFTLTALSLDPQFGGRQMDYSPLEELFAAYGVPYVVRRTDIGRIVFDVRKEPNPCALCAKMRRGALHDTARELGCNKIALGHHFDDAIETFYMNLWREGRIGCFSPVTYLSQRDLTLIRPMLLATGARRAQRNKTAGREEGEHAEKIQLSALLGAGGFGRSGPQRRAYSAQGGQRRGDGRGQGGCVRPR